MFTSEDSCPVCLLLGKTKRLMPIIYKNGEAYYTCEDKKCIYFLTDKEGNPLKFQCNDDRPCKKTSVSNKSYGNNTDEYLDEFLKSFPSQCGNQESSIQYFSPQVPVENKSNLNDTFDIDLLIQDVLR